MFKRWFEAVRDWLGSEEAEAGHELMAAERAIMDEFDSIKARVAALETKVGL